MVPSGRRVVWLLLVLIVGAGLLAADIYLSTRSDATGLSNGLIDFIFLAVGIGFSYAIGQRSIEAEAAASIRRDGKKAVRRIVNLARGLQDLATALDDAAVALETDAGSSNAPGVTQVLGMLRKHVEIQLRTVADAIEDWRDIVPEEVEELEHRAPA